MGWVHEIGSQKEDKTGGSRSGTEIISARVSWIALAMGALIFGIDICFG